MSQTLIAQAARSHARTTRQGLLEGLFASLFENFVYAQIWEDPRVDMAALGLDGSSRVIAIASGGCNIMSYLTRQPRRLVAVDLNRAHLALLDLKLAAARHLDDQQDFARLFGQAADRRNVALFDEVLAKLMAPESRDFWQARAINGRRRIDGFRTGLYRQGLLGRSIVLGHLLCRLLGRDPKRLLAAKSLAEQRRLFNEEIAPVFRSGLVRLLMRMPSTLFGLGIPPAQYRELVAESPDDPAGVLERRARRLLCDFPLDDSYFAHQALALSYGKAVPPYLEAQHFARLKSAAAGVEWHHASITDRLAREDSAAFDGYVLLDAQDWMTREQITALWREISRTAAPGARVIFRTAGKDAPTERLLPDEIKRGWTALPGLAARMHEQDRSAIYGGFHVYRREDA